MNENEYTQWLSDIYQCEDNFFTVEFAGKKITFTKMYSIEDLNKAIENKTEENTAFALIALLTQEPKISFEQAKRLPGPFVEKIQTAFESNISMFDEKKSSQNSTKTI